MRLAVPTFFLVLFHNISFAQANQLKIDINKVFGTEKYFSEAAATRQRAIRLFIVSGGSYTVYSNRQNTFNTFPSVKTCFSGILPDSVPIANTALKWVIKIGR
jgi:DNA gyrase inhibitor GyrI